MTDEREPEELNSEADEPEMHEIAEAEPAEAEPVTIKEEAPPAESQPRLERLQKILARAGIASRRHAEELITEGRVQVNGQVVTTLGAKADPERDHIRVDGKLLHGAERQRYFMLNKPKGYVTTVSDPEGRPTVMEFFAKMGERLYPVGRLDFQSEGLLLVTNDGELANALTRAASGVEKTYLVKVAGQPAEEELERLRTGVAIERGRLGEGRVRTAPARIRQVRAGDNPWYEVVLIEGRNRELRKMFEEIGHHVEKIRRVGYGPLVLDVEPGKLRELAPEEVAELRLAAEGKLKPRRMKTIQMLPREAGRTAGQRPERKMERWSGRKAERGGRTRAPERGAKPFRQKEERWKEPERPGREERRGREERARREGQTGRGFAERREERGPRPGGKPGFGKPKWQPKGEKQPFGAKRPGGKPGFGKPKWQPKGEEQPFGAKRPGGKPAFGAPKWQREGEEQRSGGERPVRKPFGTRFAPRGEKPAEGRMQGERRGFGKGPANPAGRGFEKGAARGGPEFRRGGRPGLEREAAPEGTPRGGQGRRPAFGGKPAGSDKSSFRGKPGAAKPHSGKPGGRPGSRTGHRPGGGPGGGRRGQP